MHDEFRTLAPASTMAAPLPPAPARRRQPGRAANDALFQRPAQLRRYLRALRWRIAWLAVFSAVVLASGAWAGRASAGGPLSLSLLFAFGGCVPAGLAAVQLHEARAVRLAFAARRRDPLQAAAGVPLWREALAFGAGALAFAALARSLLA